MSRFALLALPALLLAALAYGVDPGTRPADKPATLTATLINNKQSYKLNAAQSGEQFRKSLKDPQRNPRGAPPASGVDLTLRLSDNTDKDITIKLGGDESQINFNLTGEGAVTIDNLVPMTMEFREGQAVTIKPGRTHDIAVKSLAGGARSIARMSYFTEAGQYRLSTELIAASGESQIKIASEPITIKVAK